MGVLDERSAVRRLHDRFSFGAAAPDPAAAFAEEVERVFADPTGSAVAQVPAPQLPYVERGEQGDAAGQQAARRERGRQEQELTAWWLGRMVDSGTVQERAVWFWHGHFATSAQKVRSPALMLHQNDTFRRRGTGDFAALAQELVRDPAMILWLDGDDNTKDAPNENLAREFMELFTLGVGNYTEDDVREAARALTGWTVDRRTGRARFAAKRHDAADKQILGRRAAFDAESFVAHVLDRPESATFVVGRLWFRFVSAQAPGPETMQRLLGAYGPGRDVGAVLREIATSAEFRDDRLTMVKQPVEWLVGLLRAMRVRPDDLDEPVRRKIYQGLLGLGQVPLRPPSVGGWPAGQAHLTTASGIARLQLARVVVAQADLAPISDGPDPVDAARHVLAVDAFSERTRTALGTVAGDPEQVAVLAACAPEYVVSR